MRWTPFRRTGEAQKCHISISPDTSGLYCTAPGWGVEVISTKTVSGVGVASGSGGSAGGWVAVAGGAPQAASSPMTNKLHSTVHRRFLKRFIFLLLIMKCNGPLLHGLVRCLAML